MRKREGHDRDVNNQDKDRNEHGDYPVGNAPGDQVFLYEKNRIGYMDNGFLRIIA
jgi:hypothetical protein